MNFSITNAMNAIGGARIAANGAAPEAALALPFQQLIAIDGALPGPDPALAATDGAPPPETAGAPDDLAAASDEALAAEAAVLNPMLAAMAPPVAPAALPAMMMAMPGARPVAVDGTAQAEVSVTADATPVTAAGSATIARPALLLPAVARADASAAQAAPAPAPAPAAPATVLADADGAEAVPAPTITPTSAPGASTGSQPATARGADSLVLAGPPGAWRQNLHQALGERIELQLGRGIEQATIRLEPPMLGRIEISVRHSGGNLEVHIAASNNDVLRQLNTVSDSLRNDLAGRQYSNVALSVSETPRAQASAQAGQQQSGQPGADGQGRGRQPGEDGQRQRTPGLALNDAGEPGSLFSMNERERA